MLDETKNRLELGPIVAQRIFPLYRHDGTSVEVTVRLGKPFVANPYDPPESQMYRCPVQVAGIGDERVRAPAGEDPFVAIQYAIDLVGQLLDDLVRKENLEIRHRSNSHNWIWRYPPGSNAK